MNVPTGLTMNTTAFAKGYGGSPKPRAKADGTMLTMCEIKRFIVVVVAIVERPSARAGAHKK